MDLFNGVVDVPAVDTVLMLRPINSPLPFILQLGRGLRRAKGKSIRRRLISWGSTDGIPLRPSLPRSAWRQRASLAAQESGPALLVTSAADRRRLLGDLFGSESAKSLAASDTGLRSPRVEGRRYVRV
jgi:hypothetical protein